MKKMLRAILMGAAMLAAPYAQACEFNDSQSTFGLYEASMKAKELPLILVVGCGHGALYNTKDNGDHTHPDCWCVNLETDPSLKGFLNNTKESFKEGVQYDEILNIAMFHVPARNKESLPLRDTLPSNKVAKNIIGYKNKFDVIILERILPETLNKPWTLWNAAHMLKVGGELVIDSTHGYDSKLYVGNSEFAQKVCPSEKQDYPVNQQRIPLAKFGMASETTLPINENMVGVSDYLVHWGFTDMLNVGNLHNAKHQVYQPYTKKPGGDLETSRKTCLLSARKTQETEEKMEVWAKRIQSVKGHIFL